MPVLPVAQTIPDGKIRPVRWRTCAAGLSDIEFHFEQSDPAWVDELRKIAADDAINSERRYTAIGYLVELQHRGQIDASDLIKVFENIARASDKTAQSVIRLDAICAIAQLKDRQYGLHPQALARLIDLAKDEGFQQGRRDALKALAMTSDPSALDLLTAGVVEFGGMGLADGVSRIDLSWQDKASRLIHALQSSVRSRGQLDFSVLLHALSTQDQPATRRLEMEDVLIQAARDPKNQDIRMSGILAGLLIACEAGDAEQAGNRINAYERDHNVPSSELRNIRLQVGGPALSGILQTNLETYFQRPIYELNTSTLNGWQMALNKARTGFTVRLWMSGLVFGAGFVLLLVSSWRLLYPDASNTHIIESFAPFAAGLGTMLLIVYAGPLKDIRQSVSDLATANAVFIAYVHRILETSHTFSYYYLHEEITFEDMAKSSALIKEAMENAVRSLNMTAIDSSEDVIVRAMSFVDKLKKT
jgi:hypothetical protein